MKLVTTTELYGMKDKPIVQLIAENTSIPTVLISTFKIIKTGFWIDEPRYRALWTDCLVKEPVLGTDGTNQI